MEMGPDKLVSELDNLECPTRNTETIFGHENSDELIELCSLL